MISIIVSMYDRSRRAAVSLEETTTVGELLAQCMERWQLPTASFAFRAVATNRLLFETDTLLDGGTADGDELQIFPLLEGGAERHR